MNNILKFGIWPRVLKYPLIISLCLYPCSNNVPIDIKPDLIDDVPSQLEQSIDENVRSNTFNEVYSFPEQKCLNMIDDYEFDIFQYPNCFKNKKSSILDHICIKPKIDISKFKSDEYNMDYLRDLDIEDLDINEWYYGIKFEF
jgi:hypothetical protein